MRRIISAILLVSSVAFAHACGSTVTQSKAKKITDYFTSTLNGENAVYKNNGKISVAGIDAARKEVWNCWRSAVENFKEEKLLTATLILWAKTLIKSFLFLEDQQYLVFRVR